MKACAFARVLCHRTEAVGLRTNTLLLQRCIPRYNPDMWCAEAYIYNTREKLESKQELIEVTTKEWREEFGEKLTKMGSWLDEDGWEATTEQLQEKLSELTTVGDLAFYRMQQAIERPDAIKKARAVVRLAEESVQNLVSL